MSIGENIQAYRKNLGLSQDELGQKLLVSRQTVSLWENEQTYPSIDNLIRLKEIFGISVDEILGVAGADDSEKQTPLESYSFSFTADEVNQIYKSDKLTILRSIIPAAVIFVFLLLLFHFSSDAYNNIVYIIAIFSVYAAVIIKRLSAQKKYMTRANKRICESTYVHKIFSDYMTIDIYRNNEKVREQKYYINDIERISSNGNFLFVQIQQQVFIIRKNELKENSFFYSYMYNNPLKTVIQPIPDKWKIPADSLFIASLLSLPAALMLISAFSKDVGLVSNKMWMFFLPAPIPIASLIYGCILKSKGYKYKKNIVAGIIVTFLLCLYGSFSFIF